MNLTTNKLSLINFEKISAPLNIDIPDRDINSPIPICSTPEISYKDFTDYDKFCNVKENHKFKLPDVKENHKFKLPDIKTQQVQYNFQPLFSKRTEIKKTNNYLK